VRRALVVLLLALVGGCAHGTSTPGPNDGSDLNFDPKATIVVDDAGITPNLTHARVGDALEVTNRGTKDHGLTSESIDTGTLHPGESTTVFLTQTGTIDVRDRSDSSHEAHIDVAEASSSSS
jgi:hypothetical protein